MRICVGAIWRRSCGRGQRPGRLDVVNQCLREHRFFDIVAVTHQHMQHVQAFAHYAAWNDEQVVLCQYARRFGHRIINYAKKIVHAHSYPLARPRLMIDFARRPL